MFVLKIPPKQKNNVKKNIFAQKQQVEQIMKNAQNILLKSTKEQLMDASKIQQKTKVAKKNNYVIKLL